MGFLEKNLEDIIWKSDKSKLLLRGFDIDSFVYLPDLINSFNEVPLGSLSRLKLFTYKYGVEGIDFKSHKNYNLMYKGF